MQTIELKTAPELRRIVLAAFPSYRKHKVFLSVFSTRGERINSYWDGGTRDEYAIVELTSMRQAAMPSVGHPYYEIKGRGIPSGEDQYVSVDHVGNVTLKAIPVGFVLVSAGTFCGKPATAHLHFHPDNLAKYLEATKPQVQHTCHYPGAEPDSCRACKGS